MKSPFHNLSQEQRSQLLDTIYTGMLAINLLFLQSLLSSQPEKSAIIALANFSVGIPASAGALVSRRLHQRSTYTDKSLGIIALINTTIGIAAALQRFSLEISITFIGLTLAAAILVTLGLDLFPISPPPTHQSRDQQTQPIPSPKNNQQTTLQEQKKRKRR